MAILAVGWHPGSVNAIAPVVKRLRERGKEVKVVAYGPGKPAFERHKIIPDVTLMCIDPDISSGVMEVFRPEALLCGLSVPDSGNPLALEQELTLAAKNCWVKSVAVLDFWSSYLERVSKLDVSAVPPRITHPFMFMPDVICTIDEASRAEMLKLGFSPDGIMVTGNPHFSEIALKGRGAAQGDAKSILYCSQPISPYYGNTLGFDEHSTLREVFTIVAQIAERRREKLKLIVRKHPREANIDVSGLSHSMVEVVGNDSGDLHDAILNSSLTLGMLSTALVEARILGRPAISAQIGRRNGAQEHLATNISGITALATTGVKLALLINLALDGRLGQKGISVPPDAADNIIAHLT